MSYPAVIKTPMAQLKGWAPDTDDADLAKKVQEMRPLPNPIRFVLAEPVSFDEPLPDSVETREVKVDLLRVSRVFRGRDREEVVHRLRKAAPLWESPEGLEVDGRRFFPFGAEVKHFDEVQVRRPEVGWSSDATATPPRYDTHYEDWTL